jgi:hypothetical protein
MQERKLRPSALLIGLCPALASATELPPPPPPPPGAHVIEPPPIVPAPSEMGGDSAPVDEAPPAAERWYGEQILIADGVSGSLLLMGLLPDEQLAVPALLGTFGYLLAAPIIHGVHSRSGRAWGSFGTRVGMPLGAALFGSLLCECSDGALGGLALGMIGAITLDAAVFAWEGSAERPYARGSSATIAPSIELSSNGAALGVGGIF